MPEDDYKQLTLKHKLAIVYLEAGQIKEAINLLKRIIAMQERLSEKDYN